MIVKIFENEEIVGRAAADAIIAQINKKPDSVLGLPTGSSPVPTYKTLIAACKEGRVSFAGVKTFNLDEYVGLAPTHEQSYRYFMNDNLFDHVDIDKKNTSLPCDGSALSDEEAAKYDEKIKAAGGIDLQLLGIGNNGLSRSTSRAARSIRSHTSRRSQRTQERQTRDSLREKPTRFPSMP